MGIHGGVLPSSKPPLGRSSSFSDQLHLTSALHDDSFSLNPPSSALTMPTSNHSKRNNVFILFVFVLELLVLVFVSVLEYFLRETDVFPVRQVLFSCTDPSISQLRETGKDTYDDFAYKADVPYEVVLGLSFAVPPFVMIVCEIALWAFSDEQQKTIRVMCAFCKVPQVVRRIIRFVGTFLFGLLITMVFTDVAKLFAGRLRPTFLDTCKTNVTLCRDDILVDESVCMQRNDDKLRDARLSFPSLHAAISSYAAFFLAIYLHNVIRNPGVRIMRPFLSLCFIILSVMCGLARYGLHYSHWTDVLAGFILGFLIATYLCLYVLNCFRERLGALQLYSTLKSFFIRHRLMEFRDLYKEDRLEHDFPPGYGTGYPNYAYTGHASPATGAEWYNHGLLIPRPHVHETSTDVHLLGDGSREYQSPPLPPRTPERTSTGMKPQRTPSQQYHNTFQREINRAVEPYRATYRDYQERHRQPINGVHM